MSVLEEEKGSSPDQQMEKDENEDQQQEQEEQQGQQEQEEQEEQEQEQQEQQEQKPNGKEELNAQLITAAVENMLNSTFTLFVDLPNNKQIQLLISQGCFLHFKFSFSFSCPFHFFFSFSLFSFPVYCFFLMFYYSEISPGDALVQLRMYLNNHPLAAFYTSYSLYLGDHLLHEFGLDPALYAPPPAEEGDVLLSEEVSFF